MGAGLPPAATSAAKAAMGVGATLIVGAELAEAGAAKARAADAIGVLLGAGTGGGVSAGAFGGTTIAAENDTFHTSRAKQSIVFW